jgi:hypothetical protein
MTKIQFLAVGICLASQLSYAAHITSDASLTLGIPATAVSTGNSATNPIIWNKYASQTLWQICPDPWGVNNDAAGSINMQYAGNGSVVTTVNLSKLVSTGVNGYPHMFYGHDSNGYHMDGQPLTFPAQLSTLSSLTVDVNYSLSITGAAPGVLNVGYDEWIIPSATYTGGMTGALEVMVLPYFQSSWPPAGQLVKTFTAQVVLNGKATSMAFNEYSTGTGPGHEILFFPRDIQTATGDVRINLLDFLQEGVATAQLNTSWFISGIMFGSEFGHTSVAKYTLTTNKLSIEEEFNTAQ